MRAILALWLLLLATPATADPKIVTLKGEVDPTDAGRVLASLHLAGAFDRRFVARLESGLPTPILYRFELHGDRKRWYDNRLKGCTLEVVATHDAVARAYTVHWKLDGELIETRTVRGREGLEAAMTRIERLPILTLDGVRTRRRLLVKARAELGSRTVLSFIPVAITTDWAESPKFRRPPP